MGVIFRSAFTDKVDEPLFAALLARWRRHYCEIASKRDPTREAVHLVDHTKEFKTLVGSRFARDVTPQ
jgi:hypothetical protein